jgi:hypothetical protein
LSPAPTGTKSTRNRTLRIPPPPWVGRHLASAEDLAQAVCGALRKQCTTSPPAHTGTKLAQTMLPLLQRLVMSVAQATPQLLATRGSATTALHGPQPRFVTQPSLLLLLQEMALPLSRAKPPSVSNSPQRSCSAAHLTAKVMTPYLSLRFMFSGTYRHDKHRKWRRCCRTLRVPFPWVGRHLASTEDLAQATYKVCGNNGARDLRHIPAPDSHN